MANGFETRIENKIDDLAKRFGKIETSVALHRQSIKVCDSERKKLFNWLDGKDGLVAKVSNLEVMRGVKRNIKTDIIQLIILSCVVAGTVFGAMRLMNVKSSHSVLEQGYYNYKGESNGTTESFIKDK